MSKLIGLMILIVTINTVLCARSCIKDEDCSPGDCCIEYLPYYKRCKDHGDDEGDRCGGQFYCDCTSGLTCEKDFPSFWNYFKVGLGNCVGRLSKTRYNEEVEVMNLA